MPTFEKIFNFGVDIDDDGTVSVFGQNQSSMKACLEIIEGILEEPELDKVYKGTVVKIVDFGAFVNILPDTGGGGLLVLLRLLVLLVLLALLAAPPAGVTRLLSAHTAPPCDALTPPGRRARRG